MATAMTKRHFALQAYLYAAAAVRESSTCDVCEIGTGHHRWCEALIRRCADADYVLRCRVAFAAIAGRHCTLQRRGVDGDTAVAADQAHHDQVNCMCSLEY